MSSNDNPHCDDYGHALVRGNQPRTLTCKGKSATVEQPGWYCPSNPEHEPVLDEADIVATEGVLLALVARERRHIEVGPADLGSGRLFDGDDVAAHAESRIEATKSR